MRTSSLCSFPSVAGGKPSDVLAVQLLRHAGEGRSEVVGLFQLEVATAGVVRQSLEPPVRTRPHLDCPLKYIALASRSCKS